MLLIGLIVLSELTERLMILQRILTLGLCLIVAARATRLRIIVNTDINQLYLPAYVNQTDDQVTLVGPTYPAASERGTLSIIQYNITSRSLNSTVVLETPDRYYLRKMGYNRATDELWMNGYLVSPLLQFKGLLESVCFLNNGTFAEEITPDFSRTVPMKYYFPASGFTYALLTDQDEAFAPQKQFVKYADYSNIDMSISFGNPPLYKTIIELDKRTQHFDAIFGYRDPFEDVSTQMFKYERLAQNGQVVYQANCTVPSSHRLVGAVIAHNQEAMFAVVNVTTFSGRQNTRTELFYLAGYTTDPVMQQTDFLQISVRFTAATLHYDERKGLLLVVGELSNFITAARSSTLMVFETVPVLRLIQTLNDFNGYLPIESVWDSLQRRIIVLMDKSPSVSSSIYALNTKLYVAQTFEEDGDIGAIKRPPIPPKIASTTLQTATTSTSSASIQTTVSKEDNDSQNQNQRAPQQIDSSMLPVYLGIAFGVVFILLIALGFWVNSSTKRALEAAKKRRAAKKKHRKEKRRRKRERERIRALRGEKAKKEKPETDDADIEEGGNSDDNGSRYGEEGKSREYSGSDAKSEAPDSRFSRRQPRNHSTSAENIEVAPPAPISHPLQEPTLKVSSEPQYQAPSRRFMPVTGQSITGAIMNNRPNQKPPAYY